MLGFEATLFIDLEVRKSISSKSFLLHISKIAFEPSNSLILPILVSTQFKIALAKVNEWKINAFFNHRIKIHSSG